MRWLDDEKLRALTLAGRVDASANHAKWKEREARAWNGTPEVVGTTEPVKSPDLYPLVGLCKWARVPEPVPEYRFHPHRRWRFDYAFPLQMLAVEIEGGLWTNGRHSRGKGAIADIEKYSEAAILGWRIVYATPDELTNGTCIDRVVRALAA